MSRSGLGCRQWKWTWFAFGAPVALILFFIANIWAKAFYMRWQVDRFIAVAKTIDPGKTSRDDAEGRLNPFRKFRRVNETEEGAYQLDNTNDV